MIYSDSHTKVEVLILELRKIDTMLIAIYRPPDTSLEIFSPVLQIIRGVVEENRGHERNILLTGDLNMPIIDWNTGCINGGTIDQQRQAEA